VNETLARAFTAAAVDLASEDSFAARRLLDAADHVMTGPKGGKRQSLFLTEKAQAALVKAKEDVSAIEQNTYRFAAFKRGEEKRIAADGVMATAMDLFFEAEDVDDVDLEPLIQQAAELNLPGLVDDLRRMQESFRGARWHTDVEMMAQAEIDIWEPGSTFGMRDVARMVANRNLTEPDSRVLRSQITQRDNWLAAGSGAGDNPFRDPVFASYTQGMFTREFRDKFGFQGGELSKRANLALNDFRQHFLQMWESGEWQQKSYQEQNAMLQGLFRNYVDLRGGGRDLVSTVSETGSIAPTASYHNPSADWQTTLVLSRGEILRFSELRGKPVDEIAASLTDADLELFQMYVPINKQAIEEFISFQLRLLQNIAGAEQETDTETNE
jgi:hypothetical protein